MLNVSINAGAFGERRRRVLGLYLDKNQRPGTSQEEPMDGEKTPQREEKAFPEHSWGSLMATSSFEFPCRGRSGLIEDPPFNSDSNYSPQTMKGHSRRQAKHSSPRAPRGSRRRPASSRSSCVNPAREETLWSGSRGKSARRRSLIRNDGSESEVVAPLGVSSIIHQGLVSCQPEPETVGLASKRFRRSPETLDDRHGER